VASKQTPSEEARGALLVSMQLGSDEAARRPPPRKLAAYPVRL